MSLIDKIRKAREVEIEAGGHRFTVRRPTDEEAFSFSQYNLIEVVKKHVIGWDLKEIDIIPGGDGAPVTFDREVFCEWVSDNPDVWEPLGTAILEAYKAHAEKRNNTVKN